jgi:hypothetical protein
MLVTLLARTIRKRLHRGNVRKLCWCPIRHYSSTRHHLGPCTYSMTKQIQPTNRTSQPPHARALLCIIAALWFAGPAPRALALSSPAQVAPRIANEPFSGTPPRSMIADIAANEIRAIQHTNSYIRYRMHTHDAKGDRVRDIIESKDGAVARLILKDGHPLTAAEDEAERARLNDMLTSPSEFAKHVHNDKTGKKLAVDLISLMPDAMTYTYTPGQPQLPLPKFPRQIVLDYAPNPNWSPPNTTAEALTGLRGRMWIDPKTRDLLRMEGNIFQGVNLGWGMLAHIYPGGTLSLDQVEVGDGRWIFSRFVEQVKVRALMVKSINIDTTIEASDFQPLPGPTSYTDAIHLLLATPLPTRPGTGEAPSPR